MIDPVILAGGSGTRLWPLSRKSYPKQFANLIGEETPFQESLLRTFSTKKIIFEKPTILTNNDFRFIVKSQADGINLDLGKIIIEPQMRGTAPAIIAATLLLSKKNKNPLILVTPSDHIIHDLDKFHKSVLLGVSLAKNGEIVTATVKEVLKS